MRREIIAGNWKMFGTIPEAVELVKGLRNALAERPPEVEVLVAPPFTALSAVSSCLSGSRIRLAAQNMHWEKNGAFTGEISAAMLRDAGCSHAILGHSERRHVFGESDEAVGRKSRAALDSGLVPIICLGETLAERESDRTMEVVARQLERALRHLSPSEITAIVLAYEPVWAIGTGRTATPEQAQEVQSQLRKLVAVSHGDEAAGALPILYGGSVKPDNIGPIMAQPDVDGALVGGASLNLDSFLKIIHFPA